MKLLVITIGVVLCIVLIAGVYQWIVRGRPGVTRDISVNGHVFSVEIADTMIAQARGLSGRASLADDAGMLFLFSSPANRGFWMRGMNFPLDIIWINGTTIIGISDNLPPASIMNPRVYYPPEPADKVLEINAGLSAKLGIAVGDTIQL
ncbi:MAG: DUF192 domain-containing protein [Patescibacteria group bacterium]|nr:DUF192 domain-containing protein [Patescibacteria group bacterium]